MCVCPRCGGNVVTMWRRQATDQPLAQPNATALYLEPGDEEVDRASHHEKGVGCPVLDVVGVAPRRKHKVARHIPRCLQSRVDSGKNLKRRGRGISCYRQRGRGQAPTHTGQQQRIPTTTQKARTRTSRAVRPETITQPKANNTTHRGEGTPLGRACGRRRFGPKSSQRRGHKTRR